jgi:Protein of unknown function (DUF2806)
MDILPIKVKADLTKSIEKVTNTVCDPSRKGVSKLLNACFGSWIAKKEATIKLIEAQGNHDASLIAEGQLSYDIDSKVLNSVESIAANINIDNTQQMLETVGKAIKLLNDTPNEEISDEPLNKDFWNKWQREAEIIDEGLIKEWWAHLLKEEIKVPNKISKRTLDVVQNLGKEECELFAKLLSSCHGNNILVDKKWENNHFPINFPDFTYNHLLQLDDAGLLHKDIAIADIHLESLQNGEQSAILYLNNYIIVGDKKIVLKALPLTIAGVELFFTVPKSPFSVDEIVNIGKLISSQNKNCKIKIHKAIDSYTWYSDSYVWSSSDKN